MSFYSKNVFSIILALLMLLLSGCGSKSATDYNKLGLEYYENGDYDQAKDYLGMATLKDAENISYLQNYALVLIQLGNTDDAISILSETFNDGKKKADRVSNKYSLRILGMAYIQNHEYDKAVENFDKALEIEEEPDWNTDIRYYKANALTLSGERDAAMAEYDTIIKDDAENVAALTARADLYREMGEYSRALEDYNNALLYTEGDFKLYIGMASCYLEGGYDNEAKEALFVASLLDIKDDKDKYYLGVVHYYDGNLESAKAEMEYALANGIEEAYFYLAEIAMAEDDYEAALPYFEKYEKTTAIVSPTVCNDIAVCYINAENYDAAAEWINKGLTFESSAVIRELKRNEIACLEYQGDLSAAYAKLNDYVTLYPDDEEAVREQSFLKERVGI